MTVAFTSGKGRRIGIALGAVSAGLLVLSACDKPSPFATVTVGRDSVSGEAACYNDGKQLEPKKVAQCLKSGESMTISIEDLQEQIRFGVDPEVADKGWSLFLDGQPAEREAFKKTYRTEVAAAFFQAPQSMTGEPGKAPKERKIAIVAGEPNKTVYGIWQFTLKNKES
ncbi:DUF2771 domain-containing protein [Streptomyces sp. NPDC050504]|uniref:DUF2771 domain-containing protein n=1 Tax=Streptomyces sp. NPDC050504 TaxID=3365618 RepID=UPI0037A40638